MKPSRDIEMSSVSLGMIRMMASQSLEELAGRADFGAG
jgi:hypothetical protein